MKKTSHTFPALIVLGAVLLTSCGNDLPLKRADPLDVLKQEEALKKSAEIPEAFPGDIPIYTPIERIVDAGDFSVKDDKDPYTSVIIWLEVKDLNELKKAEEYYKNALKNTRYNKKIELSDNYKEGQTNPISQLDGFVSDTERVRINFVQHYIGGIPVIKVDYYKGA